MSYQKEFHYLDSLMSSGIKLGHQRIQTILSYLDNPQYLINTVLIAGTNGKGSTAAMINSILQHSGYKVGLYTSPHLDSFCERIRINGVPIPQDRAGQLIRDIRQQIEARPAKEGLEELTLTYFEFITVMGLSYFAQEKVDIALLEVGMGGRWDATNVVKPLISVITSIGLDHMQYLGKTLLAIAAEKAAIIKEGTKVVCSLLPHKIKHFIEDRCEVLGAELRLYGRDFWVRKQEGGLEGQQFSFFSRETKYHDLKLSLLGEYQLRNAATAIEVCHLLKNYGFLTSQKNIKQGLARVNWEGRLEVYQYDPIILLDGAHNPQAMKSLVITLKKFFANKKLFIIFGVLQDKKYDIMAKNISSHLADNVFIIVTQPSTSRVADIELVAKEFMKYGNRPVIIPNVSDAVIYALEHAQSEDVICITGSFYTVAEGRKALRSLGLAQKIEQYTNINKVLLPN